MKLNEILDKCKEKYELYGDPDYNVESISSIEDEQKNSISIVQRKNFLKHLRQLKKQKAILIKKSLFNGVEDEELRKHVFIVSDEIENLWIKIVKRLYPDKKREGVSKSAVIGENVEIGKEVFIGDNVVIEDNVKIGDGSKIFHGVVILDGSEIGKNCIIYPNVVIYERVKIGNRVIIHSGTVIGSDGFGFLKDKNGTYKKIPQIGDVIIEDDVEIGANCTIDRGAIKSTIIKKGVKLDNLVHIAHNVTVGENTVMAAQCGIAGSVEIGKNCMFGGQVGVADHVKIGNNVILYGKTGVTGNIEDNKIMAGVPMMNYKDWKLLFGRLRNKLFEILGLK